MNTPIKNEIALRFGVLPNFFRLAADDPKITANLWGFAQFAYLDNPLPSLFKERLFVYLSRFCEIRYCIARHVGFLVGLGHPAGDSSCLPQQIESILPLLRRRLPAGEALRPLFAVCAEFATPLSSFPEVDSPGEEALFACATHLFLQTPDATRAHEVLKRTLGAGDLEQLNLLLAFVRMAHYWTRLHPELVLEDDIAQLLATHEILAQCVLKDFDTHSDSLGRQVAAELASLRTLRGQHATISRAYQELAVDHQYVKHHLHESEENLRELVSSMPAAVYACDQDGIMTYYNPKAVEIWGRTPALDDRPWSFVETQRMYRMDGTALPPGKLPVQEVIATGIPLVNCELVLERPDLSRINVLANITPLRDVSGGVTGAVSIIQDVSELKRAQQDRESLLKELERSNLELSQFSYAVSHDLQAPIRNVRALAQILVRREGGFQEDSAHLLALIEQTAGGMERLIESLLRYAQVGQGDLNPQQVDLDEIVESVKVALSSLITETRAQLICTPLPELQGDPILLKQLFQNLVGNALRYRRPGEAPIVEISAEQLGAVWQFSVRDNGQGIALKYQEYVFEPLKRLHGNDIPGTGFGLTLCRTIAARHGGRIWVESEGPGCGAIFRFSLPAVQFALGITT